MMDSSENTDRYFRDKLENYRESPPQDTWDKIADQLGHRRKRKMVLFISRIAAGVTILVSLSVLFYYTHKNKRGELAIQTDTVKTIKTEQPDKSTVRFNEKQTDLTGYDVSEGIAGKTTRDRYVISGRTAGHTGEQNGQSGRSSEDEILRNNTTVEHMASTRIRFSEKVNYLIPIACNYLKTDNSTYNRELTAFIPRKEKHVNATATDHLLVYSEVESVDKEQHAEWILGGQFAPLYSYRDLRSDNYQDYVKDQINSKESGIVAYAGGINLTVSPNKRLSIQSGLYYAKYGQEKNSLENITYVYTGFEDNTDKIEWYEPASEEQIQAVIVGNTTGKIMSANEDLFNNNLSPDFPYISTDQSASNRINSSLPVRSVTQYFEYLELPVNLKYKILDKKFDVSLIGGISTNFLIGTDIQLKYTDNSTRNTDYTTEGLNRINYSGLMGIGFEYPLFKNLVLNVEPKFKYYLNAVDKEQVYDIHPYSIGIFSGISYIF
jgi:hypothetical protein